MYLSEILQQQQLITNRILIYLDAEGLAHFGSCNRSCRSIVNSTLLWLFYYFIDKKKQVGILKGKKNNLTLFERRII